MSPTRNINERMKNGSIGKAENLKIGGCFNRDWTSFRPMSVHWGRTAKTYSSQAPPIIRFGQVKEGNVEEFARQVRERRATWICSKSNQRKHQVTAESEKDQSGQQDLGKVELTRPDVQHQAGRHCLSTHTRAR